MDLPWQSNRILIIDDNEDIHEDFRKILQPISSNLKELKQAVFGQTHTEVEIPLYEIDSAYQGEEGFELVKKSIDTLRPYFMTFVDIRMPPGLNGVEIIEKIWSIDPDLQTVICTAYSDYTWQELIVKLGWSDRLLILKKPFDSIEVRQLTSALREKWYLQKQRHYQMDLLQSMVDERTAEIRGTLEATADGILVISQLSQSIDANQNFQKIWKDLTLKGEGIENILSRNDPNDLIAFITSNVSEGKSVENLIENLIFNFEDNTFNDLRLELRVKNGKIIELFTKPLEIKERMIGRVVSFRDVTEQRYFESQLTFQATHDLLTHLPNRMLLIDRLEQAIFQSRRSKTQVAVIILDLDRFKIVNDSLGHNFGDELIKAVAERLKKCMRESDTLCRVGGDEFVLIVPGLSETNLLLSTIHKLQEVIKIPFIVNSHQLNMTCSIGISFFPKNGQDADELLKNADAAMYRAKAKGKNTFEFYAEEMNIQIRELLELEQDLHLAYKSGEFLLHYQPIVDVKSGEIRGTEALLRWNHPKLGMLLPQKFMAVAEETGLIVPIGEWVLQTACEQNLIWKKKGLNPPPIAVNLSAHQVKNHESFKTIEKVLEKVSYDGSFLMLELTENLLMEVSSEVKEAFKRLNNKNVIFVIDDFGTGYSNLNYLVEYPITKIKIDRSFIKGLENEPFEKTLIQAIIAMAHSLNMKVVAEGVESEGQYQFLRENHCDEVQGFYFSKPIEAEAYEQLLKIGVLQKSTLV